MKHCYERRLSTKGAPQDVYNNPVNPFCCQILGTPPSIFFKGYIKDGVFIGEDRILDTELPNKRQHRNSA